MTDATELDLDAIRARLDAATPGPWRVDEIARVWADRDPAGWDAFHIAACRDAIGRATEDDEADAEFIAHARTDVERLLAALDEARSIHRDLVSRLGFGDNITERMADNDTVIAWFEQQSRDASEWQESQLWRNDCCAAGHPDDEDCWEHDPALRLVAAESSLAAVRALADETEAWAWRAPVGPGNASYANGYENGRRSVARDLRALASTPPDDTTSAVVAEAAVGLALSTFERLSNLWAERETPETEDTMFHELNAAIADARRVALSDPDTARPGFDFRGRPLPPSKRGED